MLSRDPERWFRGRVVDTLSTERAANRGTPFLLSIRYDARGLCPSVVGVAGPLKETMLDELDASDESDGASELLRVGSFDDCARSVWSSD